MGRCARRCRLDRWPGRAPAAHFAHDPTLVALLTHQLTGISFSFTAHARDLYQIPRRALVDRVAAGTAVITWWPANLRYLDQLLPPDQRGKAHLIHHGVDLDRFRPSTNPLPVGQGRPLILSVGRLVEKKGFPDLLHACALLMHEGRRFRCAIYGDSPLRPQLTTLMSALQLSDTVTLAGERPQRELVAIFQSAAVFALAPFVTTDGDRDGVPNVLVEAMACGLPVVSTRAAGVPDLVQHEHNGLLAEPRDASDLARQVGRLLDDEALRARLGRAARATVTAWFDQRAAADQIAKLFDRTMRYGRPLPTFPLTVYEPTRTTSSNSSDPGG